MKLATSILLVLLLFTASALGDTISLKDEKLYCERYSISFWCEEGGQEFLANLTPEILSQDKYLNEYAFSDAVRYTGVLKIKDVNVIADLLTTSSVEATYQIENPSNNTINTKIVALETPENTKLYVDGQLVDVDPLLDGYNATFKAGQKKTIKLVFAEPLYGQIFGYNINLLFDGKTTDNQVTPTGTFTFTLPQGAAIKKCLPSQSPGYTTATDNGRTVVTWHETDFIPWTNPFNGRICTWTAGGAPAAQGAESQPQQGGGNSMIIWAAVIVIILGGLYWANRTGRLDGIRDRLGM